MIFESNPRFPFKDCLAQNDISPPPQSPLSSSLKNISHLIFVSTISIVGTSLLPLVLLVVFLLKLFPHRLEAGLPNLISCTRYFFIGPRTKFKVWKNWSWAQKCDISVQRWLSCQTIWIRNAWWPHPSKDIQKNPKTSKDIQRHSKTSNTSKDIQWHPETSKDIQRHPKTFKNIQKHPMTSNDIMYWKCLVTSSICRQISWMLRSPILWTAFQFSSTFFALYQHRHHQARISGHLNTVHRILGSLSLSLLLFQCTHYSEFFA